MRNINWSKWIAIALSIFIVTQFIQVSFLAAGQIESSRSDAGADASRGSLAEGIYQDVWEKVGDGSDMILSARADGGKVSALVNSGTDWDLTGQATDNLTNLSLPLVFALLDGQTMAEDETFSFSLPEGFTAEAADVSFGNVGTAHIVGGTVDITVTSPWDSDTQALTINNISYNGTLEAHTSAEDTSVTQNTWAIVDNSTLTVSLPKTAYVETEPTTDPEETPAIPAADPATPLGSPATPATSTTIRVLVQDAAATPEPLSSGTFRLQRSETEDGEFSDYATITVNAAAGEEQAIADGYYQLTQTAVTEGYTALEGTIAFSVSGGAITSEASGTGWEYSEGAFTVTNAVAQVMLRGVPLLRGTADASITVKRTKGFYKRESTGVVLDESLVTSAITYKLEDATTPEQTSSTGSAEYTGLNSGTEYLASDATASPAAADGYDGVVDYAYVGTSRTTNVLNSTTHKAPVTAVTGSTSVTLVDLQAYKIALKDASGAYISNRKITVTPATNSAFSDNQPWYEWVTVNADTEIVGKFVRGDNYTLKLFADAAGSSVSATYNISVAADGALTVTTLDTGYAKSYSGYTLTLTENPLVKLQLVDRSTNANINVANVQYKLAPYTTANPTGEETAEVVTVSTNSNGMIVAAPVVPNSGTTKYYLTEVTTPAGYRPNNTTASKVYYTFTLSNTGVITYTVDGNEAAVSKGWVASPTGPQRIKYATTTQEQLNVQLTDADATGASIARLSSEYALYSRSGSIYSEVTSIPLTVSDSGKITSTALPAVATDTTYYFCEKTAPSGYTAKGSTTRYPIIVRADGVIEYPLTDADWSEGTGGGAKLAYSEKRVSLTLIRNDVTSTSTTAIVRYGVYTNAACTTEVTGSPIILTRDTTKAQGTLPNLVWGNYYIKDLTAVTDGYTRDEVDYHGPYVLNGSMTSGTVDTTRCTADLSTMTMSVEITPAARKTATFRYVDSSNAVKSGTFKITDKATSREETLTVTSGTGTMNTLLTGHSYTVTQLTGMSDGVAAISYEFTVRDTGAIKIDKQNAGTTTSDEAASSTVTMKETLAKISFTMEICTAEGEPGGEYSDKVSSSETGVPEGFTFSLYSDSDLASGHQVTRNALNNTISIKTNNQGVVEIEGLTASEYWLTKGTVPSSSSNNKYSKVQSDKDSDGGLSVFKLSIANNTTTVTKVNSDGNWVVKNNKIRAYLQKGGIELKAQSGKTFYLYRLYKGDGDSYDERATDKMKGSTVSYSTDDKKKYFVTATTSTSSSNSTKTSWLGMPLKAKIKELEGLFVLTAKAADDASVLNYAGQKWQMIDSSTPGTGNSHTFSGLIAGQQYLVREGSEDDSEKKYYLSSAVTANKDTVLNASSSTGSSGSTIRSGASNSASTSTGSGTKGSSGGGRGAATGDGNDLWMHLIVMLIAFDALVADLLYISRKKQPVRSR